MYALWCCYRQLSQLKLLTRLKAYLAAMAKVCDFPLHSIDAEIIIGFLQSYSTYIYVCYVIVIFWAFFPIRSRSDHPPENMI